MTEEKEEAVRHIVNLYEEHLKDVLEVEDNFSLNMLPKKVKEAVDLTIAKTPQFSNIAGLATANYVISHIVGQCRPRINEVAYSSDLLGASIYTILVSNSGTGKSSSVNTLLKACNPAIELVESKRIERNEHRAKMIALREKRTEDPNAQLEDLEPTDWQDLVKPLNRTIIPPTSTRGGTSTLLDKLQNEEFGNMAVMFDELGLSLKNGTTTQEVLQLLIEAYDVGNSLAPIYKTDELKETPITGMYSNMLGHTSPRVLFGDAQIKDTLAMLFHTALARRVFFSMPDDVESNENDITPTSIKEAKEMSNRRLKAVSELSMLLNEHSYSVVSKMLAGEVNRVVGFEEDAAELYKDYYDYCQKRSQLVEDSSIPQIELSGRPFKLGKLAAIWQLWEGTNSITYATLKSAIQFAEYNSKYLDKFLALTSSKAYTLLGNEFKEGNITSITLDKAMQNGYVGRVTKDFKDLLDPMNSYLAKVGIVSYSQEDKTFYYSPFKMVEETGDYGISYTKVEGVAKEDRIKYLDNFQTYKMCTMKHLGQMLTMDTIYNVFRYNDGPNKNGDMVTMNRNQKYLASNTKLLSIDVDDSEMPIEEMHGYLSEFKHLIATTSDVNNKHKFRILLPVNIEIDGSQQGLYRCIMRKVSEALLIKPDTTSFNPAQPMYGYDGAELFVNEEGLLYDISDIISECVQDDTSGIVERTVPKTTQAKQKLVKEIMANANQVFDYVINCQRGTGSLSLARASMHMRDSGFGPDQYRQVINYLNSMWQVPMNEERLEKIIDQYISKMEG